MVCPFMECSHDGCRKMFTIQNIDKAIAVCANKFTQCNIFQREIDKSREQKPLPRR
ncbi:MAG: hypothetical protein HY719_01530 [Planctomycetes bacterium]|nr:hypothetical protein [Planctomycetota bacterium]